MHWNVIGGGWLVNANRVEFLSVGAARPAALILCNARSWTRRWVCDVGCLFTATHADTVRLGTAVGGVSGLRHPVMYARYDGTGPFGRDPMVRVTRNGARAVHSSVRKGGT